MREKAVKEKETEGSIPPPYPLAMVICDNIWHDRGTGKRFLLGCFSTIHATSFPATHPGMAVYVAITNGRGKVPMRIQLVDAGEEREPLWVAEAEVDFSDPRSVVELEFIMQSVTFPAPGEYRFQLFASGKWNMERRFLVNELEEVE